MVATQLFNLLLVWHLKHVGLSLAIGLGSCVNAGLLFLVLRLRNIYRPRNHWGIYLKQLCVALIAMALGLIAVQWLIDLQWENVSGTLKAVQLGILILIAMVLYFGTLFLVGIRPHHFKRVEHT